MSEPTKAEWRKMPRAEKDTWVRRVLAEIRGAIVGRDVCPACWIPFSDWFLWDGLRYCWPCHAANRDAPIIFEVRHCVTQRRW